MEYDIIMDIYIMEFDFIFRATSQFTRDLELSLLLLPRGVIYYFNINIAHASFRTIFFP